MSLNKNFQVISLPWATPVGFIQSSLRGFRALEQRPVLISQLRTTVDKKAGAQKDPIPINRTDTLKKLQCVESLTELTLKYCLSFLLVTLRKSPNRSTLREKGLISSCRPSLWGNPGCRNRRQLERLNPQS